MGSNLIGSPYAICKGSLLTRNQYDRDGRCIFELWIKSNEANIQLIITDERPVCFATLQNVKLLQTTSTALYPSIEITQVKLKTFADEDVYAIYVNSLSEFYQLRKSATQQSIELLEADVKPVDRYLMERFIQLGVTFTGVEVSSKGNYQRFEQVKVKSSREAFPMLKAMSIDIECDENGYLFLLVFMLLPKTVMMRILLRSSTMLKILPQVLKLITRYPTLNGYKVNARFCNV
ncbi:hypothetical protein [Psychrosphaera algicola]|uniref:Uncharacterized protein n=1 Tax=Psychrosphaera algicola TaxID=3023714 RepID=A0ABT5FII6_9GAMM|nr:hypothetical protein [Psychrosphaera sp. G1-22]MDC2891003.1 hypothetical protein [Psychrosphaera sp. G1-22]